MLLRRAKGAFNVAADSVLGPAELAAAVRAGGSSPVLRDCAHGRSV